MVYLAHRRDRCQLTKLPIRGETRSASLNTGPDAATAVDAVARAEAIAGAEADAGAEANAALQIEVRLFAAAADLAATRRVVLQLAAGSSLEQVQRELTELYPALQVLASVSRWAIDEQFVSDDFRLHGHATVAMIPPVSGG